MFGDDDLRAMEGAALPDAVHPAIVRQPVEADAPWTPDQVLRHDATDEQIRASYYRDHGREPLRDAAVRVARELAEAVAAQLVAEDRQERLQEHLRLADELRESFRAELQQVVEAVKEMNDNLRSLAGVAADHDPEDALELIGERLAQLAAVTQERDRLKKFVAEVADGPCHSWSDYCLDCGNRNVPLCQTCEARALAAEEGRSDG